MSEPTFHEPRIALNRIYTKIGDRGETRLVGGQKRSKTDTRIECYGTVDELNAFVGAARVSVIEFQKTAPRLSTLGTILNRVQHELFNLGSILATLPEDVHPKQPRVTEAEVAQLEREIDAANEEVHPLRSFVLPGSTRLDADLHVCRTVCRRAERSLVGLLTTEPAPAEALQYLNRLSDAFFVLGRWANAILGTPELLWEPNRAAAGSERK